jgi:hypothetical protein
VKKLSAKITNPMWKKNRNNYARVLRDMMLVENIERPFTAKPAEGPLPRLAEVIIVSPKKKVAWNSRKGLDL